MREIKFRAWNKELKFLFNVDAIDLENKTVLVKTWLDDVKYEIEIFPFDEIVLEQYTGLKDKNGVEIYEGDIVLFDKNHENNHQEKILIDFISGKKTPCFEIVYSNNLTAFRKSLIFPPEERANHKYETTIHNGDIVVGNIHENGDLLK